MHDYGWQKEKNGYSVWSLALHTGDKRELLTEVSTKRQALAAIKRFREADARRAK